MAFSGFLTCSFSSMAVIRPSQGRWSRMPTVGKTTTVEILEGYRRWDAGQVRVLGADPAHPTWPWRARIGFRRMDHGHNSGSEWSVREWRSGWIALPRCRWLRLFRTGIPGRLGRIGSLPVLRRRRVMRYRPGRPAWGRPGRSLWDWRARGRRTFVSGMQDLRLWRAVTGRPSVEAWTSGMRIAVCGPAVLCAGTEVDSWGYRQAGGRCHEKAACFRGGRACN